MECFEEYIEWVSKICNIDKIEVNSGKTLCQLGIDSLTIIKLISETECKYNIKLNYNDFIHNDFVQLYNNYIITKKPVDKYCYKYGNYSIKTLIEFIDMLQNIYYDKIIFEYSDNNNNLINISYREFYSSIKQIAYYIQKKFGSGQHITIIGQNSYEWILIFFSIIYSGNIAVLVNSELSSGEIETIIEKSNSLITICTREICNKIKSTNKYSFDEIVRKSCNIDSINITWKSCEINRNDVAVIIYTSGTTGLPKGVMLTHYNLISDTNSIIRLIKYIGTVMLILPLHHAYALVDILSVMLYGQKIYISKGISYILEELQICKAESFMTVPAILDILYLNIDSTYSEVRAKNIFRKIRYFKKTKFLRNMLGGNLRFIISGGAPLNSKYVYRYVKAGINIINGYGITECSPAVSVNRLKSKDIKSCGYILECCNVKIVNKDYNEVGEILVKGDNVMKAYYNDKELSEESIMDGWFSTGDYGKIKDSLLYVVGRKKNMILLSNGENIFPERIEGMIQLLPYVKEVIIYQKNDAIACEVYIDDKVENSNLKIEDDIKKINRSLPPYSQIRDIIIKKEPFHKNSLGKISRN